MTNNNLLRLSENGNFQLIFTWRCNFRGRWGTPKTFSKLLKLCVVQWLPIWKHFSRWELEFSKVDIFWDILTSTTKARFPLPINTGRIDGRPVSTSRVEGPCWRVVETGLNTHTESNRIDSIFDELDSSSCNHAGNQWRRCRSRCALWLCNSNVHARSINQHAGRATLSVYRWFVTSALYIPLTIYRQELVAGNVKGFSNSTQLNLLIYGSCEAGLNKHREHIIKHKA